MNGYTVLLNLRASHSLLFSCPSPLFSSRNFYDNFPIDKMPHATSPYMDTFLPTILCLHGHGTSATIFEAQTRNIRSALRSQFKFVYIDAPYESEPGPGVLPCFADSGPYYTWFLEGTADTSYSKIAAELSGLSK